MDTEMWILVGAMCAVTVVLMYIGDRMEAWWHRKHPPDDWDDGCREDKYDDDD